MATQINLRCSEEEKSSWEKKARSEGVVTAAWIRSLANNAAGLGYRGRPKAVREPQRQRSPAQPDVAPASPKTKPQAVATPDPAKALSMADAFRKIQKEKESPPAEIPD